MKKRQKHPQTRPLALQSNGSGCLTEDIREADEVPTTRGRQHATAGQVEQEVTNRNSYIEM